MDHIIRFRGKPAGSMQTAWVTLLKSAGIKCRIRPYDLRHAIVTGVDVGTAAQLMGHDPKMLLEHYQHVADKQKRAAVGALPEI
jgi:integrase